MTSLADYSVLVRQQNANTKYKKIHYTAPSFNDLLLEKDAIKKVNTLNCKCSGVVKTNNIYSNEYKDYLEFVYSPFNSQVFSTWEYYYVSIERIEEVKFKVPFIQSIDFEKEESEVDYLNANSISLITLKDTPSIEVSTFEDNVHPLLEDFLFTGRIFITNNDLVYEYFNINELLDSSQVDYLSTYQPIKFRSPLNLSTIVSVYPAQEEIAPSKLFIKNQERTFNFTGEVNNTLIRNKPLYKYEEFIDDSEKILFLPYKPFYGSLDILEKSLGKSKSIELTFIDNQQRVKIKQKSNINISIDKS